MKTLFKVLIIQLLICSGLFATDLTGIITNPDSSGVTGSIFFTLIVRGAQRPTDGCLGPASIVPTRPTSYTLTNGVIQVGAHVVGNVGDVRTDNVDVLYACRLLDHQLIGHRHGVRFGHLDHERLSNETVRANHEP